jgi:hypothetical protein
MQVGGQSPASGPHSAVCIAVAQIEMSRSAVTRNPIGEVRAHSSCSHRLAPARTGSHSRPAPPVVDLRPSRVSGASSARTAGGSAALHPVLNMKYLTPLRLLFASLLALASTPVLAQGLKAAEEKVRTVRIVVAGDQTRAIEAPRKGLATSSKTGTGLRMIPGLADPKMVTFESTRSKGTYLRHHLWKIEVSERPKDPLLQKDSDWGATWKIVKVEDDNVMLEAGNRPGEYLVVEPEGLYALAKTKNEPLRMQFKLVDK